MRRPTRTSSRIPRPPLRHIHRASLCAGALLSEVRFLAGRGDRVNIIRADGQRFTMVLNGESYLVRDDRDAPIGTHDTVAEALAAGDDHLDAVEDARRQREADFGGDDPKGAA